MSEVSKQREAQQSEAAGNRTTGTDQPDERDTLRAENERLRGTLREIWECYPGYMQRGDIGKWVASALGEQLPHFKPEDDERALRAELAEAKALNRRSVCAWCGEVTENTDNDARAKQIVDHVMDCAKHPIGKLANELDATARRLARAEELLDDSINCDTPQEQVDTVRAFLAETKR